MLTHTRLAISHASAVQPKSYSDGITIAFNGELYGCPASTFGSLSEIDYIYELYKTDSLGYANNLQGEFSIIIIDEPSGIACFSRDYFGTKPLFYWACDSVFICSSISDQVAYSGQKYYRQDQRALDIRPREIDSNRTTVLDINTLRKIQSIKLYHPNQRICSSSPKTSDVYAAWKDSLYTSFINRWPLSQDVFIPLSSGHDSGLLAAIALELGYKPTFYSIPRGENLTVLHLRLQKLISMGVDVFLFDMIEQDLPFIRQFLDDELDHVSVIDASMSEVDVVRDDPAAIGLSTILRHAQQSNYRVMLSGHGGDEIYSGYGAYGLSDNTSRFQLKVGETTYVRELFPWIHLEDGRMKQYILKEEVISSRFSIESRYPFLSTYTLDKYLDFQLRDISRNYKGPVEMLLQELDFPYDQTRVKRGFNPYSMDRSMEFMNLYRQITLSSSDVWRQ